MPLAERCESAVGRIPVSGDRLAVVSCAFVAGLLGGWAWSAILGAAYNGWGGLHPLLHWVWPYPYVYFAIVGALFEVCAIKLRKNERMARPAFALFAVAFGIVSLLSIAPLPQAIPVTLLP